MPRYRLDIEYDGSPYAGWQRQAGQHSVQAAIEQAIKGFCAQQVTIRGAGRTDAGVHAIGQVAHVDLERDWPADTVRDAVNAHLQMAGEAVSVLAVQTVAGDFDARFSAIGRHYLYRIVNRRAPLAIEAKKAWWVPKPLDAEAMHSAAQALVGRHDFTTFRSIQCQARSPVKTLDRLDVARSGEAIEIRASARSFLHNQVRSMVGSLKRVGEGAWSAPDLAAALDACDRAACGPVAPPDGLCLVKVDYPVAGSSPSATGSVEIRAKRIVLKPFTAADADDVFACITPAITRFMAWEPPASPAAFEQVWRSWVLAIQEGVELYFVVRLAGDSRCLGIVGIHAIHTTSPEIGIWLREDFQGQGFGKEAVEAVMLWATLKLRPSHFEYPVAEENLASRKIAESLGGIVAGGRSNPKYRSIVYRIPRPSNSSA